MFLKLEFYSVLEIIGMLYSLTLFKSVYLSLGVSFCRKIIRFKASLSRSLVGSTIFTADLDFVKESIFDFNDLFVELDLLDYCSRIFTLI